MSVHPAIGTGSISTQQGLAQVIADLRRRLSQMEAARTIIQAGSIKGVQIGDQAITAANIAANTITGAQIMAGSITANEILAGTITSELIAAGAIIAQHIAAGAVTAEKIDAGAVIAETIAAGAITADKIAAGAITAGAIEAGAITTDKLSAGSVTADKIAAGAVTADKISVTSLSALTTDMGNLTAGTITGGTIRTSATGSRVVMDSGGLRGYGLDGVTKVFEVNAGSGIASFTGIAYLDPSSVIPSSALTGQVSPNVLPPMAGVNMLDNSSFEFGIDHVTASGLGTSVLTTSSTWKRHGTYSLRVASTDYWTNNYIIVQYNKTVPVTAGRTYSLSTYLNVTSMPSTAFNQIEWLNSSGGHVDWAPWAPQFSGTGQTRVVSTATAPAGAAFARLRILQADTSSTNTVPFDVRVDAVQFEEGTAATTWTPSITDLSYNPQNLPNLLRNSSWESATNPDGWAGAGFNDAWGRVTWGAAFDGDYSYVVEIGTHRYPQLGSGYITLPVQGAEYTFSYYAAPKQFSAVPASTRGTIVWYDASNNQVGVDSGPQRQLATAIDKTTRFSATATAPATATKAKLYIDMDAGADPTPTPRYAFDAFQFEQNSFATPWLLHRDDIGAVGPGEITATELADGAVVASKVAAGAIIAGKIAAGAISTTELAANSVTALQIASGSITTNHIQAGAITTSKIALVNVSPNAIMQGGFEDTSAAGTFWTTSSKGVLTRSSSASSWEGQKLGALGTVKSLSRVSLPDVVDNPSGGTLVTGNYEYAITAYNAKGETGSSVWEAYIPPVVVTNPGIAGAAASNGTGAGVLAHNTTYYYSVTATGDRGETTAPVKSLAVPGLPPFVRNVTNAVQSTASTTISVPVPPNAGGGYLFAVVQMQVAATANSANTITPPAGWFLQGARQLHGTATPSTVTCVFAKGRDGTEGSSATFTSPYAGIHTAFMFDLDGADFPIYESFTQGYVAGSGTSFNAAPPATSGTFTGRPLLQITVASTTNASTLTRPSGSDALGTGQAKAGSGINGSTMNISLRSYTANNATPSANTWNDTPDGGAASEGLSLFNIIVKSPVAPGVATITLPSMPANARKLRVYRSTSSDMSGAILIGETDWATWGAPSVLDSNLNYPNTSTTWPTTNTSEVDVSRIDLSWSAISGATGYRVYRRRTSAVTAPWGRIAEQSTTSLTDTGLTANTSLVYPSTDGAYVTDSPYITQTFGAVGDGQYTASYYARGTGTTIGKQTSMQIQWYQDSTYLATTEIFPQTLTGSWQRFTMSGTAPASANRGILYIYATSILNPEEIWIDGVQVERGPTATSYTRSSVDYVPGSLGATVITPNSITTDQIMVGGIHADRIVASSITALQIAASAITADKIAAGEITATHIAAGAITAAAIQADAIDGKTITGATFQTASPPTARMVMDADGLRYVEADGTVALNLSTASGSAGLKLRSASGAQNTTNPEPARAITFTSLNGEAGKLFGTDWGTLGGQLNLVGDVGVRLKTRDVMQTSGFNFDAAVSLTNNPSSNFQQAALTAGANWLELTNALTRFHTASRPLYLGDITYSPWVDSSGTPAIRAERFRVGGQWNGVEFDTSGNPPTAGLDESWGVAAYAFDSRQCLNTNSLIAGTTGGGTTLGNGNVWATNFIGAWSDERAKENIQPLTSDVDADALTRVRRVRAKKYDKLSAVPAFGSKSTYIPGDVPVRHREIGFLAQELEAEFPDLVQTWAPTAARPMEMKWVDAGVGLSAVLWEAVNELAAEVDALKAQLGIAPGVALRKRPQA